MGARCSVKTDNADCCIAPVSISAMDSSTVARAAIESLSTFACFGLTDCDISANAFSRVQSAFLHAFIACIVLLVSLWVGLWGLFFTQAEE